MSKASLIPAVQHPMTMAALACLAHGGGWARILEAKPLETADDLRDADLLCAAGVLRDLTSEVYELLDEHPWYHDPATLAAGMRASLRRAMRYAETRRTGWDALDPELLSDQGRSSAAAARTVGESLLAMMPSSHHAFVDGHGHLLDVGAGVGAFSGELCRIFPTATATAIDVLPEAVALAIAATAKSGMDHRIEVRLESVTALRDQEKFDLAWVPQAFIPRPDLLQGLPRVFDALKPDRWLLAPICASPSREAGNFGRAVVSHQAHVTGGGPLSKSAMTALLVEIGFVDIRHHDQGDQVLTFARRP